MLEAYERLIHDAMSGDSTLFTAAEDIERLWELSTPLLEHPPDVEFYAPGSWGPAGDPRPHPAQRLAAALRAGLAQGRQAGLTPDCSRLGSASSTTLQQYQATRLR